MTTQTNGKPLSEYLEGMVQAEFLEKDIAAEANALPTPELQERALERYREEKPNLMKRIVRELQAPAMPTAAPRDEEQAMSDDSDASPRRMVSRGPQVPGKEMMDSPLEAAGNDDNKAPAGDDDVGRAGAGHDNGNTSTSRHESTKNKQALAPKKSFLTSLGRNLLQRGEDMAAYALPVTPAVSGAIAVKNAAVEAHAETADSAVIPAGIASSSPAVAGGGPIMMDAGLRPAGMTTHGPRLTERRGDDTPPAIPAPRNLHWDHPGPHQVHLMWDPPGEGTRYNLYAAYYSDHPAFDTGNDAPFTGSEAFWNAPAEGTQVFELYLKSVDSQGHESAPSNHVVADLR